MRHLCALLLVLLGAAGTLDAAEAAGRPGAAMMYGLPVRASMSHNFQPFMERRQGRPGRAVLAFSIDARGRVVRVFSLVADDASLEPQAAKALSQLRFEVPADWEANGGPWRRFRVQVTFLSKGQAPLPKLADDIDVIVITTSSSRGP